MKESMAGTWIFGIVALFIVLFSSFLAYSISYTKAFKVKNQILNLIEQNEGFTYASSVDEASVSLDDMTSEDQIKESKGVDAMAYEIIREMGYNTSKVSCEGAGTYQYGGYCVKRVCYRGTNGNSVNAVVDKVVYKVTTYIKIGIPVINLNLSLPISGETNYIYYENEFASNGGINCDEG